MKMDKNRRVSKKAATTNLYGCQHLKTRTVALVLSSLVFSAPVFDAQAIEIRVTRLSLLKQIRQAQSEKLKEQINKDWN